MVARTGDVMIWHWAHRAANPQCAAGHEGPWHLLWKYLAAPGTQECMVGDRRADVLAPGGFTVGLQASPMTAEEVWSRELDWRMRLVWIFDAAAAFSAGRLRVWRSAGQQADGQPVVFGGERFRRRPPEKRDAWDVSWSRAPARVKSACCRSILDLGGDLIYVGAWEVPGRPLRGYGWPVTRERVAVNVLNGQAIPEPAPGRRYFPQEAVAAKAQGFRSASVPAALARSGRPGAVRGALAA
jgi:hypothetical protein